jgi:putative oxygen-independent coproporphyrinogen III oxidase
LTASEPTALTRGARQASERSAVLKPPLSSRSRALYVHFPYCAKKCPYCDFNSHAVEHDDRRYADAVLAELDARAFEGPLSSIFFGGGTPSRWAPEQVGRVIRRAQEKFGFESNIEITLEANPGTVAEARMFAFVAAGVNRFSIGVQSFDDAELGSLGRIHDASRAETAVRIAKKTGARVSLDLIYALPGQSWNDVRRSLERALSLETHHVSAYTLTIEPDTVLGKKTARGLFVPMIDDLQADLIDRVSDALAKAGYVRYEISNYAQPGQESRHNSLYWIGGAYLGVGAGAHSYLPSSDLSRAMRRETVRRPESYLADPLAYEFEEELDRAQVLGDRLMVALRPRWGIDLSELAAEARVPRERLGAIDAALDQLALRGLVERVGPRVVPTARGFLMNDAIARALLAASRTLELED